MRFIVFDLLLLIMSIIITHTLCKECHRLKTLNVDKVCKYPGEGSVTCEYRIRPGTNAYLTCKPLFEYSPATPDPPHRELTCLEDGTWDLPSFDCVPECGRTTLSGNNQIIGGSTAELGTFPWHVGVYYMDWTTGKLEHICGGSLISTELVVSAGHCFYGERENRLQYARDYAVAAGKRIRSYYEMEESQQKSQIRRIYVPDGYGGLKNKQHKDIAILYLDKSFHVTSFVRPVCVDFSNANTKEQLRSEQIGKFMGWGVNETGYPYEDLQEINLPYIDRNTCQKNAPNNFSSLVTSDKICAGYLNGSSTCYGDSGGGLCFRSESDKRWYLRGILSVGDYSRENETNWCNYRFYTAFTNVANYTDWIESAMTDAGEASDSVSYAKKVHPTFLHDDDSGSKNILHEENSEIDVSRSCILLKPPTGGNFDHELCSGSCNYVSGIIFPMGSVLRYNCDKGYSLQGNSTSICHNAVWSSRPTCIELKYCPSIPLVDYLIAVCHHDDKRVSCERDVVPRTKATLQCENDYKINSDRDHFFRIEITCSANGTWNTNPASYHCTPVCGIASEIRDGPQFVNGAENAGHVHWPVFIYRIRGEQPKETLCIGTLVKPDLVITDGICAALLDFDDLPQDTIEFRVVDTFKGLRWSDYVDNRSYHQEHSIKNYRVHEAYLHQLYNIMALRLETPFISKRYVSPLCMDWSLELDIPRAGEPGMVFIFDSSTPEKGYTREPFPVISDEVCRRLLRKSKSESEITQNEFCIQTPKNTFIHGSYAVSRNGVWYLAGVITGFVDTEELKWVMILTKISYNMKWIKEVEKDL